MSFTLVVGREEDLCCELVRQHLEASGREVIFLPEDQLFPGFQFVWELQDGKSRGSVGFRGRNGAADQISSVLARFSGITTTAEEHKTKDGQYLNSEWHALVRGYVHSLPCPVVNRLRPELWYKARLSPLDMPSMLPGLRFRLPKTTVTTSYKDACAFFDLCGGQMQYSPISLPSNYCIATKEDMEKLERLSKVMPLFLSEVIDGETVRAFVAGNEVVFDHAPNEAAARICRESAEFLGLTFCEFELVKSDRADWYFLGLNCMPYLFPCSEEVRMRVIKALVAALSVGDGRMPS
jgi:hypothetical protein